LVEGIFWQEAYSFLKEGMVAQENPIIYKKGFVRAFYNNNDQQYTT